MIDVVTLDKFSFAFTVVLLFLLSGSIIAAEDLQSYTPQWKTPLRVNLTNPNLTLHLMPPPGGGLILGHILSILDGKYLMSPSGGGLILGHILSILDGKYLMSPPGGGLILVHIFSILDGKYLMPPAGGGLIPSHILCILDGTSCLECCVYGKFR